MAVLSIQQAAQMALDVQDASNLSGVAHSLADDILPTLWAQSECAGSTRMINQHPIVQLFVAKMAELSGVCLASLHESYGVAEEKVKKMAGGEVLR